MRDMRETITILEMPRNPYLSAYFNHKGLIVGDTWYATEYMEWIENQHLLFLEQKHLPQDMTLSKKNERKFIEMLKC